MSSNTPHPRTIALERQVTIEIRAGNLAEAIEILRLAQDRNRTHGVCESCSNYAADTSSTQETSYIPGSAGGTTNSDLRAERLPSS